MEKSIYDNPVNWQAVYSELVDIIGSDNTLKVFHSFRGTTVNFPMRLVKREVIITAVKQDFAKGLKVRQIGNKYDLAERTVQKYLNL